MLGAAGMFATMYSTQAILPELSRDFDVSPSRAGLSISVVVLAVAVGGFAWGPVSDRIGRPRAIRLASVLLVPPTIGVALAPGFEALLVCRTLQGLCMPGLLTVGAPYVVEAFVPRIGARAMGYYVSALVVGGLVGQARRRPRERASSAGASRSARSPLLPLAAAIAMRSGLPEPALPRAGGGIAQHLANVRLIGVSIGAGALFFTFVGDVHLRHLPARGATVLVLGRRLEPRLPALADGRGRTAGGPRSPTGSAGVASLSSPSRSRLPGSCSRCSNLLPLLVLGLACVAAAMFAGVTATQLGVSDVARVDRGAATALYFGVYYGCGALGAYLPGLAWQAWGWVGVASVGLVALGFATAGIVVAGEGRRRHVT